MNFIPYGKQTVDQHDMDAVVYALESDFLTTGPKINEFEKAIANYCDAAYCVAVSNGTAALHLASLVLLKKGDKVLTTPNSFLATSNAVLYAGARPQFIDIGEDGNIDLDLCEKELQKDASIKAIYAVHFSGNPIDQTKLANLKKRYNVTVLEDCAHSIGALDNGIKAGSCTNSDCSIFSFHPVKHMTTGEGGAITTNSKELYEKLLILRNHGMIKTDTMKLWEYEMQFLGFNYRISDLQCALGISQLKKLDTFIAKRKEIAKIYDKAFKDTVVTPLYLFDNRSSYHLYVVQVNFDQVKVSKETLFMKMREKNIGLQVHYIPINKQPFYKNLGYGEEVTPNMDKYYKECFSLPIYPLLSTGEQEYAIASLFEVLDV
jgi:UDP-4-amino-4,6-dideoxy-N-acetyl-beta-L-altrosamine transaminase